MKTASENKIASLNAYFSNDPPESPARTVNEHLYTIADTFVQAQQRREDADYNTAKVWTPDEVKTQILTITEAFRIWNIVRDEAVAQAYLVSFLGTKERRQNEPRKPPGRTKRKKKQARPDSPPTA